MVGWRMAKLTSQMIIVNLMHRKGFKLCRQFCPLWTPCSRKFDTASRYYKMQTNYRHNPWPLRSSSPSRKKWRRPSRASRWKNHNREPLGALWRSVTEEPRWRPQEVVVSHSSRHRRVKWCAAHEPKGAITTLTRPSLPTELPRAGLVTKIIEASSSHAK